MKKIIYLCLFVWGTVCSCTKDKTDYEALLKQNSQEEYSFKQALTYTQSGYTLQIEAINGAFNQGYNDLRVKISKANGTANEQISNVKILPLLTLADNQYASCPHSKSLTWSSASQSFEGNVVFTNISSTNQ